MEVKMKNRNESLNANRTDIKKIFVGILVFGSVWGLLDAISVAYFAPFFHIRHLCLCPLTVVIFGFFLMTIALNIYKKPIMLIGIGLIAASFKLLNFAIVPLPVVNGYVAYQPVVNPALAAFVASVVYALFVSLLMNKMERNIFIRIITGALAGFISVVFFVYAAFYLTNTHPLIVDTPIQYLFPFEGPVTAFLGAIFLPLGYLAGIKFQYRNIFLPVKKQWLYYITACFIVVACIGLSTLVLTYRS